MNRFSIVALVCAGAIAAAGCGSDASVASHNLSKAADMFEIDRRIVFYNGVTGDYILSIEGRCSINKDNRDAQLEVTCKTGQKELIMSLTIDDIKLIDDLLGQRFDQKLEPVIRDLGALKMNVDTLGRRFQNLEDEVARLDRSVKAIESFPVPYGRPRTYHSGTELQSVSKPVRRRQSYMG